jgi:CheY-specific phosphatase CheX
MASQFFGQYLLAQNLLTARQLLAAVDYQDAHNLRLGEYAVRKGYLSLEDSNRIHRLQTTKDVQFGTAAVELGLLTEEQLHELLRAQKNDHLYLGDVIVRLGFMTPDAMKTALDQHRNEQRGADGDTLYIPSDVPVAPLAAEVFDLTRKLLLRLWGLQSKYGSTLPAETRLTPGEIAVAVSFTGEVKSRYIFGVPEAVVARSLRRLFGSEPSSRDDLVDLTAEFANVVAGNLAAGMSNIGKKVEVQPPKPLSGEVELEPQRAIALNLLTPLGDVCVAVTY